MNIFFYFSLQEAFAQLDLNGDGRLSRKEVEAALGKVHLFLIDEKLLFVLNILYKHCLLKIHLLIFMKLRLYLQKTISF